MYVVDQNNASERSLWKILRCFESDFYIWMGDI